MAPELEQAARNLVGRALIVKVNTDAVPELGDRFRIRSIPTLALFRGGREISPSSGIASSGRHSGARQLANLLFLLLDWRCAPPSAKKSLKGSISSHLLSNLLTDSCRLWPVGV